MNFWAIIEMTYRPISRLIDSSYCCLVRGTIEKLRVVRINRGLNRGSFTCMIVRLSKTTETTGDLAPIISHASIELGWARRVSQKDVTAC